MAKSRRAKKQIKEKEPKNGFLMAKQGLNKIWILKDQIGLIWGEPDGRRREEEEEEEKRKEEESIQASQGMETEFMHGFYEIMHEFPCFVGYPLAQI